jgi:hypothetical protein
MTPKEFFFDYYNIDLERYYHEGNLDFADFGHFNQRSLNDVFWVMKKYAQIMCQKQKEICAEEAKDCKYGFYEDLALNSPFPTELQDEI